MPLPCQNFVCLLAQICEQIRNIHGNTLCIPYSISKSSRHIISPFRQASVCTRCTFSNASTVCLHERKSCLTSRKWLILLLSRTTSTANDSGCLCAFLSVGTIIRNIIFHFIFSKTCVVWNCNCNL